MTDEIRVSFPASSGLPDLVLPVSEVKPDGHLFGQEGDETRGQVVTVGEWSMERDVNLSGQHVAIQEDTDADLDYVREAIAAWASWWLWLAQQENKGENA